MLTSSDLISLGIKPNKDFGEILRKSKEFSSKEEAIEFAKTFLIHNKNDIKRPSIEEGSVLEWLLNDGRKILPPFLEGRVGESSNSEIRRLVENKAVIINGIAPPANASMDNQCPIWQLIFFPNGKRRTTIIDDCKPNDAMPWFDVDGNLIELEKKNDYLEKT